MMALLLKKIFVIDFYYYFFVLYFLINRFIMQSNYNAIVERVLIQTWNYNDDSWRVDRPYVPKKNFKLAVPIIAKIAVEEAAKKYPEIHAEISNPDCARFIENKVSEYVKSHFTSLREAIKSGYPFTQSESERVLRHNLHDSCSIIDSQFLVLLEDDAWLSEEELTVRENLARYDSELISRTCVKLMTRYLQGNLKAGYYLLWMIKNDTGADYQIPESQSFKFGDVEWVLSRFIENKGTVESPHRLFEICFARGSWGPKSTQKFLFNRLFRQSYHTDFLRYGLMQLAKLPKDYKLPTEVLEFFLINLNLFQSDFLTEEKLKVLGQMLVKEECLTAKEFFVEQHFQTYANANYHFLSLLKHYIGANFEVPAPEHCTSDVVKRVIAQAVEEGPSPRLMDLLLTSFSDAGLGEEETLFYTLFLDKEQQKTFPAKVLQQLKEVPFKQWSTKFSTLFSVFQLLGDNATRKQEANALAMSADEDTATVCRHIAGIYNAKTPAESTDCLHRLSSIFWGVTHEALEEIFGKRIEQVIFYNVHELLKGTSGEICAHEGCVFVMVQKNGSSHLIASDLNTKKMIWGHPLTHPVDEYQIVGDGIALVSKQTDRVELLDRKTGELKNTYVKRPGCDIRVASEEVVYQYNHEKLFIGDEEIALQTPFNVKKFSTHFIASHEKGLDLISPSGFRKTIPSCVDAASWGDKVILVEKDPSQEENFLITIRSLSDDAQVVSDPEKVISIGAENLVAGEVSDNDILVVFSKNSLQSPHAEPIFIDLKTNSVTRAIWNINTEKYFIDKSSGNIWSYAHSSGGDEYGEVTSAVDGQRENYSFPWNRLVHVEKGRPLYRAVE